ncbi:GTP-binding protein [bacterium]|nr:GTP-binding protein [bacterium]
MREIPIVLIGHKDHGKSTLIGRLILDTKSVQETRLKEIQEVDKSSGQKFELAHLVDTFKEEREREMTMDTTRAILKGKKRKYQLIDVPGHKELIASMLTGAAGAQGALLVVDVNEGIKEQTRQHLEIAKLLGIEQLGVAVNKMDKVDYQQEEFEKVIQKLREVLNKIGYLSERIDFFPISAWEGDNVVKRSNKMDWYKGKTIMEFIEEDIKEPESFRDLPLIFLVQDKYPNEDKEILVGPIESGRLRVGQKVLILPDKRECEIKTIRDFTGELLEAEAGQNIGIEISQEDKTLSGVSRGNVITSLDSQVRTDQEVSGEVFWIRAPSDSNLVLECGTASVEGQLMEPKMITEGQTTSYRILLSKKMAVFPRSRTILGKIVLKDKGKIIAVGNIQ